MFNSKSQSPCLISSWLFTPCSSPFGTSYMFFENAHHPHHTSLRNPDSFVYPLGPGQHYNTPWNNSQSATPCRCNTVLFSTIAACATCQGMGQFIYPCVSYLHSPTSRVPKLTPPLWQMATLFPKLLHHLRTDVSYRHNILTFASLSHVRLEGTLRIFLLAPPSRHGRTSTSQ